MLSIKAKQVRIEFNGNFDGKIEECESNYQSITENLSLVFVNQTNFKANILN